MARPNRREFLRNSGLLCAGALTGGLSLGCQRGESLEDVRRRLAEVDPKLTCTDTTGLWPAEEQTRTDNEYTDLSPQDDRFCINCKNYVVPKDDGCGTCRTVKGPIHPGGWCKSWTERV